MATELKTIKVLPDTVQDLNLISALTGETQYEVAARLAAEGRKQAEKNNTSNKSKKVKSK